MVQLTSVVVVVVEPLAALTGAGAHLWLCVCPAETCWIGSVLSRAVFVPAGSHEEGFVPGRQTDAQIC